MTRPSPLKSRQFSPLAQQLERLPYKQEVVGPAPTGATRARSSAARTPVSQAGNGGPIPPVPTILTTNPSCDNRNCLCRSCDPLQRSVKATCRLLGPIPGGRGEGEVTGGWTPKRLIRSVAAQAVECAALSTLQNVAIRAY